MRRLLLLTLVMAMLASLGTWPGAAFAAADRRGTVTPGRRFTWNGSLATGSNVQYDADAGQPCGKSPTNYCDTTLLRVGVDRGFWNARGGGVQVRLFDYQPSSASDFDLYIYRSDARARRGALVASSAGLPAAEELTTIPQATGYYLVTVVYYSVPESQYRGEARFALRRKIPPEVDRPGGLQEALASNPGRGFRSHSEPHIAQNPRNPNMLIAASKMYNRDRDSLREYEFKIGTYVSFDRGRSWRDLGQLETCPPAQAPPASWPNNRCYPGENPRRGGTGPEDDRDRRGRGDYGEEYITSDPWVQFDDAGNAFVMVLDAPPFEGDFMSGGGWGMSLHRWDSVSRADVASGRTWGRRTPINLYSSGLEQQLLLDDKNTFAVNNAGPDRDGRTGIMVACWGQNIQAAIKQQVACKRSTDGGRSWPGAAVPVSPPTQQLVIGVHVIADERDPNTFYAVWLHYVPGVVGAPDEMWVAKSVDGGQTWLPPVLAAQLNGIPRAFPGQSFRNLSLPIAAASRQGDLYVVYADYRPAPRPAQDEDGRQADIMIVKSSDGGITWSAPAKVNRDNSNADQFQPYVAVTPSGQVNVAYFDRRNDRRVTRGATVVHPGNFFIDTYLSRSNNGGRSFTDIRLSHDMWDPSINPPISPSGHFIGDYQGLVADNCFAIPFVNDTHLANRAGRDSGFDRGLPRSRFQEVFSWRVPNTRRFGGQARGGGCARGGAGASSPSVNLPSPSTSVRPLPPRAYGQDRVKNAGSRTKRRVDSLVEGASAADAGGGLPLLKR